MPVAAIDIGTNTVLLLVAARAEDGTSRAVHEAATITRLGQGVDKTRKLAPDAVARTIACLEEYARETKRIGVTDVAVVGTSAMRDAEGGEAVKDAVRALFGVEARVIAGEEEADLAFRGALSGLPGYGDHDPVAIFDIGGGSTEVVLDQRVRAEGFVPYARSFDMGSVRLTERVQPADPPSPDDLERLREGARDAFGELPKLGTSHPPIGIAGTVTTIAAVHFGLAVYDGARVHGQILARGDVESILARLAGLPLAERVKVPGLEPKRADVILAGASVVLGVLDALDASGFRVSDRGVRWGLAERLLAPRYSRSGARG